MADLKRTPETQSFETTARVLKVDEELGMVFGFAIVSKVDGEPHFDRQGDHIPESAMLKASMRFAESARPALEMHKGEERGQNVFLFPLTSDIAKALNIETRKTGLLVGMKPDPAMLQKFKSGELQAFSIGGRRVREEVISE